MARKVEIQKEKILAAGLDMLIRDGWPSINIKTLAREIGCSTQPIAWQFGSMENFRKELAAYALSYANEKMKPRGDNPLRTFLKIGCTYLDMAFDQPNLVKFLQVGYAGSRSSDGIGYIFNEEKSKALEKGLSMLLGITEEQAREFVVTAVIFTQGLTSMILSGAVDCQREKAYRMIQDAGIMYLTSVGITREKAAEFYAAAQY